MMLWLDSLRPLFPHVDPMLSAGSAAYLSSDMQPLHLNTSGAGESTAFLGKLFLQLIILTVKKFPPCF